MTGISWILRLRRPFSAAFILLAFSGGIQAQFTAPTAEERAMTSVPQVPGAAAVYLYREEATYDALHTRSVYVRLKVLTEQGKSFAEVEIPFSKDDAGEAVENVEGRTIHADGSIVPLTSKPYDKRISKFGEAEKTVKVFTLPAVEAGSIVEYRYRLHHDEGWVNAPKWIVQSNLYTVKAHFVWQVTADANHIWSVGGGFRVFHDLPVPTASMGWVSTLPKGVEVQKNIRPAIPPLKPELTTYTVDVSEVPPVLDDEFMPPVDSFRYRVIFFYSYADNAADYWKLAGKAWSKERERVIGPGKEMKAAVEKLFTPGDTQEEKLRKLYAVVMALENTDYRPRTAGELNAEGSPRREIADDIWGGQRGNSRQLTDLFLSMARAAGMKAYAMAVVSRKRSIFNPGLMDFEQLDDEIAIVNIDGKDRYFDPGQRYCEFGHLAWQHGLTVGVRQTDKETMTATTPAEPSKTANIRRVANLTLDEQGNVTGKVDLAYTGDAALAWRQEALRGDQASVQQGLRESLAAMLPAGLDVKVISVDHLTEPEVPLAVHCEVRGMAAKSMGKKLVVPSDLFRSNVTPNFRQAERTTPVDFQYASITQDAIKINFPASLGVESLPASDSFTFRAAAAYNVKTESTPTSYIIRRNLTEADVLFPLKDYPDLRAFYDKLEEKDRQPVVFTHKEAEVTLAKPVS